MSKRNKERKIQKQQNTELRKYRELIKDLLYGLDKYGVKFEVVDNDNTLFEDSDSEFLTCPFAVKYTIKRDMVKFSDMIYLNDSGTGFVQWKNGEEVEVDSPSWFFIAYSDYLIDRLHDNK